MSDPIMQKLDEMQELTCSSPVPLGVSVARHVDRLLAETRRELRTCIAALRAVLALHHPVEVEPSDTLCGHCSYQLPSGRFLGKLVEYPCPTAKTIAKALGVES